MGRRPIQERLAPFLIGLYADERTGYYPASLQAIPVSRVGHLRVTHPFAAFRGPKPLSSLDSHSLSTPLACVLSQDQTLHRICGQPGGSLRRTAVVALDHQLGWVAEQGSTGAFSLPRRATQFSRIGGTRGSLSPSAHLRPAKFNCTAALRSGQGAFCRAMPPVAKHGMPH